jgi:hypothetical protein
MYVEYLLDAELGERQISHEIQKAPLLGSLQL